MISSSASFSPRSTPTFILLPITSKVNSRSISCRIRTCYAPTVKIVSAISKPAFFAGLHGSTEITINPALCLISKGSVTSLGRDDPLDERGTDLDVA
jgi:hypothetical protein